MRATNQQSALLFYHFFHPDNVVSAQQFKGLAEMLGQDGWDVEVATSNRCRSNPKQSFPRSDEINGVSIKRFWRPALNQERSIGRIINALWMLWVWSFYAFWRKPDVIIIGTDPIFSILIAVPWKLIRPRTKIVHWCFDLYPEAAVADGLLPADSWLTRLVQRLCTYAYGKCDAIVDIGPCMRDRMSSAYPTSAKRLTITPWALDEPEACPSTEQSERSLYHQDDVLLMYSGSFGKAHTYKELIGFGQQLVADNLKIVFSVGERSREMLAKHVGQDSDQNITFLPLAPIERLRERLASADVHIVTLKDSWTGTVVPSKFFGALAVGRPVLFVGSSESSIARWIVQHDLGWVLDESDFLSTEQSITYDYVCTAERQDMNERCFETYHRHFSKKIAEEKWLALMSDLLSK